MQRPLFITQLDIDRWSHNLDNDREIPKIISAPPVLREILYASLWLAEQLQQEGCSQELIVRIQYTMGALSFGHDPWQVAQEMLTAYQNNDLQFEIDYSEDIAD
jgi:hypothetical protein